MDWLFDFQRTLYTAVAETLRAIETGSLSELPSLAFAALGFGMLHALLPGHGKSVLTSYFAGDGRYLGALTSSAVLILTHVGSAVILVLGGFAILRTTIVGAGRAPELEYASHGLIVVIGLWLLWRTRRTHTAHQRHSGPVLGFVTGLIPCPLTTFAMTYAVANGVVAAGLVLSATFAAGMIVTVAAFPLIAVLLRSRLVSLLEQSGSWRIGLGRALEILSALAVVSLGGWFLLRDASVI